jgi:hypothetical protein
MWRNEACHVRQSALAWDVSWRQPAPSHTSPQPPKPFPCPFMSPGGWGVLARTEVSRYPVTLRPLRAVAPGLGVAGLADRRAPAAQGLHDLVEWHRAAEIMALDMSATGIAHLARTAPLFRRPRPWSGRHDADLEPRPAQAEEISRTFFGHRCLLVNLIDIRFHPRLNSERWVLERPG